MIRVGIISSSVTVVTVTQIETFLYDVGVKSQLEISDVTKLVSKSKSKYFNELMHYSG